MLTDLVSFEVDALDFVISATAFDSAGFDDAAGGSAERIAHVGLLEDFLVASAGAAIGEELRGRDDRATGAVDGVDETEADGIDEGNAEVDVPGKGGILDFGISIFD